MANPKQLYRRNTTWRHGVMRSLTTDVLRYGKITTTITRAKELRKHVDKMITKAKTNTLASRRQAAAFLRNVNVSEKETILQHLFSKIGPKYAKRNGGYTRIIKLPRRLGDNTRMAVIELV
ncbi:50S ribosomal protein L17 [Mycoplasmopsis californica]|uniref:Large ribosomal subunit protein bL17 n=1 Tax=Mycoplasmopsis equigenitalium TaxID=114883 RepID=A0ABY5J1J1_9BACT|nr:50S ribosomal protein L17 [Mycoplasmopsis equigenitalium]UUD37109.1 50S ribosomal protein L17 [Mycoplasmopsis equigenitalium]VEU69587.1 50S ribosomal protein L17 [Mycoplasmopsis californica]